MQEVDQIISEELARKDYRFNSGIHCKKTYWDWEQEVNKELLSKGYKYPSWRTGEGDSFGPLSRILTVRTPSGEVIERISI